MSFAVKFFASEKKDNLSVAAQVIKEQAFVYALWVHQPNAKQAYIIIHVAKAKHSEFVRLIKSETAFDLSGYGEILYKGWDMPKSDQQLFFRERYGLYM